MWLSRIVSFLGDAWALVALIIFVADRGHRGLGVALLLIAGDFTPALLSPLLGVVAGRLPVRIALVGCELGQAAAIGAIALFRPPLALVFLLVAAQSLVGAVFQAASRAVVPDLVGDADLETANALLGFGTNGLEVLGPVLAALFIAVFNPRGALALDALTFLVSAALLLGVGGQERPERPSRTFFRDAAAGLRWMWNDGPIRIVALAFFAVVAFTAVDDIALVFLGTDTFHTSGSATGLLYAGSGLGLLVGFLLLARTGTRGRGRAQRPVELALAGFALASAGNLLTGLAPVLAVAFLTQVVRGLGVSMIDVGSNTLIQRRAPAAIRAQVFANLAGLVGLAAGISYLLGGALIDVLSPRAVFVIAGGGGLLVTLVAASRVRRGSS